MGAGDVQQGAAPLLGPRPLPHNGDAAKGEGWRGPLGPPAIIGGNAVHHRGQPLGRPLSYNNWRRRCLCRRLTVAAAGAWLLLLLTLLQAVVRSLPGEPNMTITLTVGGKQRNMDRCGGLRRPQQLAARVVELLLPPCGTGSPCRPRLTMNLCCPLCRPKDELLEKPLGRLQKSAGPAGDRQQKRQKGKQAAAASAEALPPGAAAAAASAAGPFVGLYAGPSEQHPVLDAAAVTNEEAWRQGRLLRIGDASYEIELNPPLLDRIELHARPFVGIPLVPAVQVRAFRNSNAIWVLWQMRGGQRTAPACPPTRLLLLAPPPSPFGVPAAALF